MAYSPNNPRKQLPGTYINVPIIHEFSDDLAIFEALVDIAEECVEQGISFNYRLYKLALGLLKRIHLQPPPLPLNVEAEMQWVSYLLYIALDKASPSTCYLGASKERVIGFWQKKPREEKPRKKG